MKTAKLVLSFLAMLSLAACQNAGVSNKTVGTVVGAGTGALIGSQIGSGTGRLIAVAVGTLAGAWLGGELGARLDERDRAMMSSTTNQALDRAATGETVRWNNPQSGNSGSTTPTSPPQSTASGTCRSFTQDVVVAGQEEVRKGNACQQPDGSWRIMG